MIILSTRVVSNQNNVQTVLFTRILQEIFSLILKLTHYTNFN